MNPLAVDLVRGPRVESTHLVHVVVTDTAGAVVRAWGDADRVTHPRSAVKPLQALPLVESGAADAFGCTPAELALACASHNGEDGHVDAVEAWLERLGLSATDLECGVQPNLARADGRETAAANNCSGKHAGFLTLARHLGVDPRGYIRADHAVQQLVTAALAETTATRLDPAASGTDGCGIPIHPVPLRALALAATRFGQPPPEWPGERIAAATRLGDAMTAHPWLVAGTGRLCTDLMADATGERVLAKTGAEGVYFAALPSRGLGIALKAEDGTTRAAEIALGHVLASIEGVDRTAVFAPRRTLTNWVGTPVATLVARD